MNDFFNAEWEKIQAKQERLDMQKATILMREVVRLVGEGKAIELANEIAWQEYAMSEILTHRDEVTRPKYF